MATDGLIEMNSISYEGVYAPARPCNGQELRSVAVLSPIPYWEQFLGRSPGGVLLGFLPIRLEHPQRADIRATYASL
jgi:hypothetical protein